MLDGARTLLGSFASAVRSRAGAQARRQLAAKDAEIAALRRELSQAGGTSRNVSGAPVFFVLGQQKSGTTWLERTLDAHPEILCRGEGRFFGGGWRRENLAGKGIERPPSSLYNALLEDEYLRLWIERSVWSRDEPSREHLDNLTRMAADYFLRGELLKTKKKIVGDKSVLLTPETMAEVGKVFPEARVIHIIRDGRDSAVSAAHHTWNFSDARRENAAARRRREAYRENLRAGGAPGGSIFFEKQLRKLASDWATRVTRAAKDGPALLGENYAEVRYEDLLARPEREVERLLRFLGADAGEEFVRRCVGAASFERLSKGRERGEEDPTSFFRKGVSGDWKNVFTQEDRAVFKEEAGDALVSLGYERDEDW